MYTFGAAWPIKQLHIWYHTTWTYSINPLTNSWTFLKQTFWNDTSWYWKSRHSYGYRPVQKWADRIHPNWTSQYFGELTNLLNLDLSHNNLTGTIPFSLFYKANKTSINLSYNSLNGTISVTLVKALPPDSLMGNKNLHIAITDCPLCIPPHPWTTKKARKSSCNPKQFRFPS